MHGRSSDTLRSPGATQPGERRRELTTRDRIRLQARAMRLLMRGVTHRMNNVLAVCSAQAQLLEAKDAEITEGARSLRRSLARGGRIMQLVGEVLEFTDALDRDTGAAPMSSNLAALLHELGDLLLLEKGGARYPVRVEARTHVRIPAARADLLVAVLLVAEHCLIEIPRELRGSIHLQLVREAPSGGRSRARLSVGFHFAAGHLPFPIAARPLLAELRLLLASLGCRWKRRRDAAVYELDLFRA